MRNNDSILGEKVARFLIKQNQDFESSDDEILIDELIVDLEMSVIRISPVVNSDEIIWECFTRDTLNEHSLKDYSAIQQYVGRTLSATWTCTNSNGYFDLLILGLDRLHPTLLILSEGGVLKVIEAKSFGRPA